MAETWMINESIVIPSAAVYACTFVSNSQTFESIKMIPAIPRESPPVMWYGDHTIVWSAMWENEAYRTVTFETAPTGDLLAWLEANAVKQEAPSAKLTFDLATLDLAVGTHSVKVLPKGDGINYRDADLDLCTKVEYTQPEKYLFDDTITWKTTDAFGNSVVFISNGVTYDRFTVKAPSTTKGIYYGLNGVDTIAFDYRSSTVNKGWVDQKYRIIEFPNGVPAGLKIETFLANHATKL